MSHSFAVLCRLLYLGGAAVISSDVIYQNKVRGETRPVTHAFFDEGGSRDSEMCKKLQRMGVTCCDPRFISEFLISVKSYKCSL